jgi:hypothetical protein
MHDLLMISACFFAAVRDSDTRCTRNASNRAWNEQCSKQEKFKIKDIWFADILIYLGLRCYDRYFPIACSDEDLETNQIFQNYIQSIKRKWSILNGSSECLVWLFLQEIELIIIHAKENLNFELYNLAVIILLCLLLALICVFEAVNDRCNNQAQKHVHCTANDIKISVIDFRNEGV